MGVFMFFLNAALGVCFAFYLIFSAIFSPERLFGPVRKKEWIMLIILAFLEFFATVVVVIIS